MVSELQQFLIKKKLIIVSALAALTYNNWVLGPFLNYNLFNHNGSISEFSVASQPYHWLFQSLDITSGGLLIWLGWSLWRQLRNSRIGQLLAATAVILGIANIFDAVFRLPCSETLNRLCQIPVSLSLSGYHVPAHAYSSVLVGICYLFLPLAGAILAYRRKLWLLVGASLVLITDDTFSVASFLEDYIKNGGPTTQTSGSSQEIQMLILGVWLIILILAITQAHQATNRTKPVATKEIPK